METIPLEFFVGPILIIAAGLGHYYWYKYVSPYPEKLLNEIDQRSFLGFGSLAYQPEPGIAMALIGSIMLLILAYPWIGQFFQ